MTPIKFSINRLATELGMDRRTLTKRLADLAPAEEVAKGGRRDRTFWLKDVFAHLSGRPSGDDYANERTRLTRAQADKTELELRELQGQLVRLPEVEAHWGDMVSSMRARLLPLPSRLAAQVAPPDRIAEAESAARALVYEALAEIAGDALPAAARERAHAQ